MSEMLSLASRGHPVVPVYQPGEEGGCSCSRGRECPSPAKHPRTKRGVDDATADLATVREWEERWPMANVGIRTGGRRVVLDIDPRNGGDDTLAWLERDGKVPPAPTVATGGGGKHFWLKAPAGTPGVTLGPGVDLKGEGGFVVAPDSIHASGRQYVWLDRERRLPPAPPWALAHSGTRTATPPDEWVAILTDGVGQGERNRTCARLVGYLLDRRVDVYVALELVRCWNARNRPPLDDDELQRVVASIGRREARKRKAAA